MNQQKEILVVGHKSPDTDSICSAIAYANLKNKLTGQQYTPRRAGDLNKETAFALSYFGVEPPAYLADVRTRVSDMEIKEVPAVNAKISIKQAYSLMKECEASTLCITNEENHLEGLITISNVAASDMDVYDNRIVSKAKTPYENIVKVLEAKVICGDVSGTFDQGRVTIAANTPERMVDYVAEHDMVIIGNRFESQFFAIEIGASCIILSTNAEPNETSIERAKRKGCIILSSPYDSYTVARLINQSMPIRFLMKEKEGIVKFQTEDFIEDIQTVMAKLRHRDFPVEDTQGNYVGMISRRNLLGAGKKKLILVDHNERGQAVNGVETAEILEIIDHHRLGAIQTVSPVFFRNQPLGSTATIIYHMYQENQAEIDKNTAALLCSAIISDTLIFKSPTCTSDDVAACMQLAKKAELDIETYGREMFRAGSNLSGKSAKEIFYQDYKKFSVNNVAIGVGQINSMSAEELEKVKPRLAEFIQGVVQDNSAGIVYFLLTDIVSESSEVLCAGNNANAVIYQAFGVEVKDACVKLQGVVSRKKQFFPAIVEALQQ